MDKVDNSVKRNIFDQFVPTIGVFAKQPVPGQVKTRLSPPLTPEQACTLYETALRETVSMLKSTGLHLFICYVGKSNWFSETFPGVPLIAQRGDNLGSRMSQAVTDLFAAGGGPVLLCGSDNPDLPADRILQVVELLREQDIASVPCSDGGYAVVGLRQPDVAVFDDIPWSTSQVLASTRQRCQGLELSYGETEPWEDLDKADDLLRLVKRSPHSSTAQYVQKELMGFLPHR